jgi:hypothetical protein
MRRPFHRFHGDPRVSWGIPPSLQPGVLGDDDPPHRLLSTKHNYRLRDAPSLWKRMGILKLYHVVIGVDAFRCDYYIRSLTPNTHMLALVREG